MLQEWIIYCILGNFRRRKNFHRSVRSDHFVEKKTTTKLYWDAKTYHRWAWRAQISCRKFLQVALKPWNSWMLSPSKVFHHNIMVIHVSFLVWLNKSHYERGWWARKYWYCKNIVAFLWIGVFAKTNCSNPVTTIHILSTAHFCGSSDHACTVSQPSQRIANRQTLSHAPSGPWLKCLHNVHALT